jgi:hypothetical protein
MQIPNPVFSGIADIYGVAAYSLAEKLWSAHSCALVARSLKPWCNNTNHRHMKPITACAPVGSEVLVGACRWRTLVPLPLAAKSLSAHSCALAPSLAAKSLSAHSCALVPSLAKKVWSAHSCALVARRSSGCEERQEGVFIHVRKARNELGT